MEEERGGETMGWGAAMGVEEVAGEEQGRLEGKDEGREGWRERMRRGRAGGVDMARVEVTGGRRDRRRGD